MSDWNIKDFPLFVGIGKAAPGVFLFPAFNATGYAVQTSKDRLGGITTDLAVRCIAVDMDYQAHKAHAEYAHASAELDKAALGSVQTIPPAGARAIMAPVLNYADPRRYSSSVWPTPWENWRWILNGPGEMANNSAQTHADFADAQIYTIASWALLGRYDGGYDPAVNGWYDSRGGRKASDMWTTLPLGELDCYYMRGDDGYKVVIAERGVIRRVYWFVHTRKSHSLRAIALFVAVFAVAAGAAYVATASGASGAGAAAPAGGAAGAASTAPATASTGAASATAGGGAATVGGGTAAGAGAGGMTLAETLGAATSTVGTVTQTLQTAGAAVAAVNQVTGAGAAPAATRPPVTVTPPVESLPEWVVPALAGAAFLAYTLTT